MLPMTVRRRPNARGAFLALVAAFVGAGPALAQSSITIGQTGVLSAGDSQNGGLLLAQQATLSRAATVSSLSFYVTSAAGQLRLGLYDATGPNGGPGVLRAQTSGFKPVKGWNTATAVSATPLPAGSYWLAYLPSSNVLGFVKQNNSGSCYYQPRAFGNGLPSRFSKTPQNCTPTTWSLYAVLTASGGGSVSGACGSSNGAALKSAPATNLCAAGTASTVSGSGPWRWSCAGSNGGATAQCSASVAATAVNGVCGAANNVAVSGAPTSNLCTAGTASAVSGGNPWVWTCAGRNGGKTASCSAPLASSSGGGTGSGAGILPSDRNASANWQKAGMLSVGGIPNRTTVCATVKPLGSGRDDTTNIQNAVNACPLGRVVQLAAGTFTIAEGNYVLLNKGITLRGAGPGVTTLQRTNGAKLDSDAPGSNPSPIIIVGPMRWGNPETAAALTADAAAGANSLRVASASGFSVGQIVLLDEASGASWQTDPQGRGKIWASPDFRVVWQKHNPSQGYDDFDAGTYPYTAASAGCWFSNCDRPTNEIKQISAISGNTITFDSPITISYRVSHHAQLYYYGAPQTTDAGVENMTLSGGDDGSLRFEWAAYSWAKNVENTLWLGEGFAIDNSFRIQLEEFYVHGAAWPVPGGGGYAISFANGSSEALIENGISVQANKVMVARSSGAGSVIAYNYMDDGYIDGQEYWQEIGLNGSHMVGSHHMLFEGNYGFNMDSDTTHGNSIYHTFFRNYTTGYRGRFTEPKALGGVTIDDTNNLPGGNGPLRAAGAMCYTYWMSFLGNVLGTPGHTSGWVYDTTFTGSSPGIWMLGWDDIAPYPTDAKVASTAIRDGNFDYLTNTVVWASNDTAHTLSSSLYLTEKPAFFAAGSGYTWPWVNPTGPTRLYTLPAKARYDAGTPFTQP